MFSANSIQWIIAMNAGNSLPQLDRWGDVIEPSWHSLLSQLPWEESFEFLRNSLPPISRSLKPNWPWDNTEVEVEVGFLRWTRMNFRFCCKQPNSMQSQKTWEIWNSHSLLVDFWLLTHSPVAYINWYRVDLIHCSDSSWCVWTRTFSVRREKESKENCQN